RSAPAARACATSSEPTATRAISSSATGCTSAPASPAGDAEARFAASRRGSGLLFSARAASASGFGLQPLLYHRIDEFRHVAAKSRDLAHQRRRDEHVLLRGREENGCKVGIEAAVHPGELELVFEVRHRAQAAQHDARLLLAHEIDKQAVEADHLEVLDAAKHFAGHVDALLQGKKGALRPAVGDAEDHGVEQ